MPVIKFTALGGREPSVEARIGYEIDNLWNGTEQAWYPIPGHELRAPLTWSVLPGRGGVIDGTDFRATEIAALFIASGYRLRQNPTYTRNSPAAYDSLPLSYPPRMLLSGHQRPHISAKMGAFGAWHCSHDLHMSPPPGNPLQTGIQKSIASLRTVYLRRRGEACS